MAAASAGTAAAITGGTIAASTLVTVAEVGWMAGTLIGNMIFRQKGPNPPDIRIQDSAYGKPIPLVYGMYRVSGNIIWAGQPYVSDAGKGGKGPSQTKVSMSFAVGLCAGPIAGVRRIWANGKLIYDVSNPSNFQAISGSSQMVGNFTVYAGDENQQPDPTMQAALGVANVPAYRGLAYIVFNNLDLSQWGNYLPSFSFEVLTQASATAYSNIAASFTAPWNPPILLSMPNLSGSGGTAMAYNGYIYGQQAPIAVSMSAYGAQQIIAPQVNSGGLFGMPIGNSDKAGIWTTTGWLRPDGTFDDLTLSGGWMGRVSTFWRNGEDLYVGSGSAGYTTVARLQIVDGVPGGDPAVNPTGGTVLAQSVSLSGGFTVVGGTSSYVYAINGTTLYRLNRTTLATVASWSSPGAAFNNFANIGCAYDDDHIYLQYSGALPGQATVYLFRPSLNTLTAIGEGPFGTSVAASFAVVSPVFFVFGQGGTDTSSSFSLGYMYVVEGQAYTTLGAIVADICNRAGLTSSQYDASQLTDIVQGFAVTNHSSARSNLAPLMSSYFFDACDTDGVIKFVKRGRAISGAFASGDLGASPTMGDDANMNPIAEVIAQEVDMPRSFSIVYPELNSDYNPNTQRAVRALTNSNKDAVVQVPIVLAGSDARARAESMLWATWLGRKTFTFSTPLGYLQYEPGDVMTLQNPNGEAYTVRITRCQYDGQGTLLWSASLDDPGIYPNPSYTAQGGAAAGFAAQQIDYSGPTFVTVMDVPPLRDSDATQGLYIAVCGAASNWPGCTLELSRDGSTYVDLMNINKSAVMGVTQGALPAFGGGNQPDELSTVTVALFNGTLSSCSYSDFLSGLNAAYIGGEIVFFRNATQIAANTYTLSGLLRGRGGTEAAMSTHATGDAFVLLDATRIAPLSILLGDIGSTLYFEAFLMNLYGNNVSASTKVTPANARVKPLSPALFTALPGSASSTSDITLSWIRRARVNAQWLDGADVALDESSESYTLTMLNGSTVVRTVTISGPFTAPAVPTYTYTAAQITADGFSSGQTITFTVQQHSDQGVLGASATTTITR
jgi:hypothetical protein